MAAKRDLRAVDSGPVPHEDAALSLVWMSTYRLFFAFHPRELFEFSQES